MSLGAWEKGKVEFPSCNMWEAFLPWFHKAWDNKFYHYTKSTWGQGKRCCWHNRRCRQSLFDLNLTEWFNVSAFISKTHIQDYTVSCTLWSKSTWTVKGGTQWKHLPAWHASLSLLSTSGNFPWLVLLLLKLHWPSRAAEHCSRLISSKQTFRPVFPLESHT